MVIEIMKLLQCIEIDFMYWPTIGLQASEIVLCGSSASQDGRVRQTTRQRLKRAARINPYTYL